MASFVPISGLGGVELQGMSTSMRSHSRGVHGIFDALLPAASSGATTSNLVSNLQMQFDLNDAAAAQKRTLIYVLAAAATVAMLAGLTWELAHE